MATPISSTALKIAGRPRPKRRPGANIFGGNESIGGPTYAGGAVGSAATARDLVQPPGPTAPGSGLHPLTAAVRATARKGRR